MNWRKSDESDGAQECFQHVVHVVDRCSHARLLKRRMGKASGWNRPIEFDATLLAALLWHGRFRILPSCAKWRFGNEISRQILPDAQQWRTSRASKIKM